jgi:transposase
MEKSSTQMPAAVVGLDLGDRYSQACFIDPATGAESRQLRLRTTPRDLERVFPSTPHLRIALEVGTHSPWVSSLLAELGHEVFVANPREVRLIACSRKKNDRFDARALARIARLDPTLLAPVHHRGQAARRDLAMLRARAAVVSSRTLLVNHLRGAVKSAGSRLPQCSTDRLHKIAGQALPHDLATALQPILELLATLSERIHDYDRAVEHLARQHPDTAALRQVHGVGTLTSLAYVLTLEDPQRFAKSRTVGAYLGLAPGTRSSGERDPQMHISREGDPFLRQLLVQCAQYILGPFGQDSDLRRHGLALALRGGKAAKKRAVVAVARKLAVLLHRLWVTQAAYQPLKSVPEAA